MNENFLLCKEIDKSTLERGFAIPVAVQEIFSFNLRGGRLAHGEKRKVTIFLDGEDFDVTLSSSGFNRAKYSEHAEQWQILYGKNSDFARRIREKFFSRENHRRETNLK